MLAFMVACLSCGGGTPASPTPGPSSPVTGGPQVLVGAGDISMCDQNAEATARLLDGIPGTVFTLGDHAYYHGTRQEFRDCYDPAWGRHKARTRPIPGNHDYESQDAAPYFEYFGRAAGAPGAGYYSYEAGAWHVIALNSNIDLGQQLSWLRNDLAAHPTTCTLVYWHHPLFTSGPDGATPEMRQFWNVLYEAGAEIVLNGHEHYYERYAPQDPNGRFDAARGIRQFIVGTGGAMLYAPLGVLPNSEVRISTFGVLKLTLDSGSYQWQFIPVSGASDSGSGQCH